MSREKVEQYLEKENYADRIIVLEDSSATVEEAAHALGCEPEHIAKTMSFLLDEKPLLVVMAGDVKVDNRKFKDLFPQEAAHDCVRALWKSSSGTLLAAFARLQSRKTWPSSWMSRSNASRRYPGCR